MIIRTIVRAFNILKFEKNTYLEISLDKNSVYGSGIIILTAALVNVNIFNIYVLPNLPIKVPLFYVFFMWIFFNWFIFSIVIQFVAKTIGAGKNFENKKIALSFIGFSNTAEILKVIIIFFPNFIVLISWGVLMLVLASQVLGAQQIYNLKSTSIAIGAVILAYITQFLIIGFIVLILIKLAY